MKKLAFLFTFTATGILLTSIFPIVQDAISWHTIVLISALLLVLVLAEQSPLYPHIITFDLLLLIGVFLGIALKLLLGDISHLRWAPYSWVALSVTISIFSPFPFLKK